MSDDRLEFERLKPKRWQRALSAEFMEAINMNHQYEPHRMRLMLSEKLGGILEDAFMRSRLDSNLEIPS